MSETARDEGKVVNIEDLKEVIQKGREQVKETIGGRHGQALNVPSAITEGLFRFFSPEDVAILGVGSAIDSGTLMGKLEAFNRANESALAFVLSEKRLELDDCKGIILKIYNASSKMAEVSRESLPAMINAIGMQLYLLDEIANHGNETPIDIPDIDDESEDAIEEVYSIAHGDFMQMLGKVKKDPERAKKAIKDGIEAVEDAIEEIRSRMELG